MSYTRKFYYPAKRNDRKGHSFYSVRRFKAFAALLGGASITDAAMLAGFDSPSHFAAEAKTAAEIAHTESAGAALIKYFL